MINSFSSYLHSNSTESKRLQMIRWICVNSKRLYIIKTRGLLLGFVCLFHFVFYFLLFYFLTISDLISQSSYSQNVCLIFHLQKINSTRHYLIIIMTNTDKVICKSTLGWIPKSGEILTSYKTSS